MSRPIVNRLHREISKLPRSLFRGDALVAGKWTNLADTFEVTHPVNGERLIQVSNCGVAETRASIDGAKSAQIEWSQKTAKERAAIIRKWGELIMENEDHLGMIIFVQSKLCSISGSFFFCLNRNFSCVDNC